MEHLESYQMANYNTYGFLDLISKIASLSHLYQSFNKLENKHLRWFELQYLYTLYLFVYENKKIWMELQKFFFLLLQEILNSNPRPLYFRK
jgi:hypothetical protein